MNSVGETLRRARVEQGLDLAEVAARTKINSKYLTAIEEDDRKVLPGSFFYRNWAHQYALALSLDAQQIDAELERLLGGEAPPPLPGQDGNPIRPREPELVVKDKPFYRRLLGAAGLLLLVAVGCSGVYFWWKKSVRAKRIIAPVTMETSVEPKSAPVEPVSVAREQRPRSAKPPREHVVLDFVAKEETWLEVLSDGKRVFSGVLQPNESRSIEGSQMAKLTVGNAAGLEVRLNGKVVGPLGPHGRVRVVVFTRDNFQIVPGGQVSDLSKKSPT